MVVKHHNHDAAEAKVYQLKMSVNIVYYVYPEN